MIKKFSETDLIKGLREENEAVIKFVYNTYDSRAYKIVLNNNGTKEDAETVFHDSLVSLIENIRNDKFKEESKLATYLTGIIKFKWLAELKKRKRDIVRLDDTYENVAVYVNDEEEVRERNKALDDVEKYMSELKEDCQKLLTGYYYKKQKLMDIAKEMEYTDAFVRVKKVRCLKALKTIIETNRI